jgi:CheY-like chemotaxis protein
MYVQQQVGHLMKTAHAERRTAPALRVVIAEADDDTRNLYREALWRLSVDIVSACDGREALVQCFIQPPALVITDTRLPFVDGYSLCELLRRDPLTRAVPIVVVTAEIRTAELTALNHLGAITVLSKPVSVDLLADAVERLRDEPATSAPAHTPLDAEAGDDSAFETGHPSIATRRFRRFETTTPPAFPPPLRCPDCDRLLEFRKSRIGGVTRQNAEQWDEFCCPECSGAFEYRHRTKKLRLIR